jgi:uncharacterized protein YcgL (UPF0745 family)
VKCVVYRSASRDFTYLYLREGLDFDEVPEDLLAMFGPTEKVMELDLSDDRRLAQEDPVTVRANLAAQGWHLQLPPKDDPSGWLDLPNARRPE